MLTAARPAAATAPRRPTRRRAGRARGFTLVELMIGIAVGLFVVAGAALMFTSHLDENRRLILETQVQQDLRAAADLITRDLRRAGYWKGSELGVWQPGGAAPPENPYETLVSELPDEVGDTIEYGYSLDESVPQDENHVLDDHDVSGFRRVEDALWMQLGRGNWQQLTDPNTLRVTDFQIILRDETIDLSGFCASACDPLLDACPVQHVRWFVVLIEGEAANDPTVRRSMRTTVRARNDAVTGACPP